MTIEIVLAIAGIALLVYSILGVKIKRLEAKEYKVITDPLDRWQRILLAILGTLFIVIAILPIFKEIFTATKPEIILTPTVTSDTISTLTQTPVMLPSETPILPSTTLSAIPSEVSEMTDKKFYSGCISNDIWTPYRSESQIIDENDCWEIPGLSAQDDGLLMYLQSKTLFGTYGISTDVDKNSVVEFDINVEKMSASPNEIVSNISFGLVPRSSLDPSGGLVFLLQVETFAQDFLYLKYREPGQINSSYLQPHYQFSSNYHIRIEISDIFLAISINGDTNIIEPINIPISDYVFWIGYQIPDGGNLSARISDFSIVNP